MVIFWSSSVNLGQLAFGVLGEVGKSLFSSSDSGSSIDGNTEV